MNIKELLENEEVREALELELNEMLADRVKSLEEAKTAIEAQKKTADREAFIARKALIHKVKLYEEHLKEHYEKQFVAYTKKLAADTFTYVQESLDKTIKAIAEDAKANTKAAKIQESLSQVVRVLAPHMDLNEASQTSNSAAEKARAELNDALKKVKELQEAIQAKDLHAAIVAESVKVDATERALFEESLKVLAPKTVAEVQTAAKNVRELLAKSKAEATLAEATALLPKANETVLAEGTTPKIKVTPKKAGTYDALAGVVNLNKLP